MVFFLADASLTTQKINFKHRKHWLNIEKMKQLRSTALYVMRVCSILE